MFQRNQSSIHLILAVVAFVLFGFAGFGWPAPIDVYRVKLIGAGLFFLTLSTFF